MTSYNPPLSREQTGCMPRYQEISQYGDAGIILVAIEDPYSRLVQSISKCEYSAIGFYAPSTSTGVPKIIVTLVDFFNVETPSWLCSGYTLDKLIHNPLVTRLAFKPLRLQEGANYSREIARFRACICRGIGMVKKPTPEESIFALFGYNGPNQLGKCITGIDLVNQVISLYGAMDKIQPGSIPSLNSWEELKTSRESPDQLDVIGMMGLPFAYGNNLVDISSYLVDTNLFGQLIEIALPKHNPNYVAAEKQKMLQLLRPNLIKGLSTFVDLLLTQPDFLACVITRLQDGKRFAQASQRILLETLLSFSEVSADVLALLETIPIDDKEATFIAKITQVKTRLEQEYFTACLYLNSGEEERSTTTNKEQLFSGILGLKAWMQQVVIQTSTWDSQPQPVNVDMATLTSLINQVSGSNFTLSYEPTPAILNWKKKDTTPYRHQFKSGRVIYLDRTNPHLDTFTSRELTEIASQLNYFDESYDYLRNAVANQLALLHNVTEI